MEPPAYVRTARCMQLYGVVCCCVLLYAVVCCCMLLCAVVFCCVLLCAVFSMTPWRFHFPLRNYDFNVLTFLSNIETFLVQTRNIPIVKRTYVGAEFETECDLLLHVLITHWWWPVA